MPPTTKKDKKSQKAQATRKKREPRVRKYLSYVHFEIEVSAAWAEKAHPAVQLPETRRETKNVKAVVWNLSHLVVLQAQHGKLRQRRERLQSLQRRNLYPSNQSKHRGHTIARENGYSLEKK